MNKTSQKEYQDQAGPSSYLMDNSFEDMVYPNTGNKIEKSQVSYRQKENKSTCYSPNMLDRFETQLLRSIKMNRTIPATLFVLFTHLPMELQRKIWFHALPPPDITQIEFKLRALRDVPDIKLYFDVISPRIADDEPKQLTLYNLQLVCYKSREIVLSHYERLKFMRGNPGKKIRVPSDWDDSFREVSLAAIQGPMFDMRFDNLNIVNMSYLQSSMNRYEFSLDLTLLQTLTVGKRDLDSLDRVQETSNTFWESVESLCPNLRQLFIVLSTSHKHLQSAHRIFLGTSFIKPQFRDFDENFIELLKTSQYMGFCSNGEKIQNAVLQSSIQCEDISQKTPERDYWKKIEIKPVWMVYAAPYFPQYEILARLEGPFMVVEAHDLRVYYRCNADGTLPGQYEGIEELFDEGCD